MKKPIFLAFLLILILCIGSGNAMTVSGSRFSATMNPGDSASFSMTLKPDNAAEQGLPLTISKTGDCAGWLTVNPGTKLVLVPGSVVSAQVKVPAETFGGSYRCDIRYLAPPQGVIQTAIAVPVTLQISGPAAPTTAPTPVITAAPTEIPTPMASSAPVVAKEVTMQAPAPDPVVGQWSVPPVVGGIILALAVGFGIVIFYDYRREKK